MKVRCVDVSTPRTDGQMGPPTSIKLGGVYKVAELLPDTGQYSLMNDQFKLARYSMARFEMVDDSPVLPLRQGFNSLTTELRARIKQLESQLI